MKQRFTLFLILAWISAGAFGQAFSGFTPAQKPTSPERPSGYHALLDGYKALKQTIVRKSVSALNTYLDTAQIQVAIENDQYLPVMNQIITYDVSGNMTWVQSLALNNQYFWENYMLTELSYDTNGNTSQVIRNEWSTGSSSWIPRDKTEYSYNADNKLVQILDYEWGASVGQFRNTNKVEITLDEDGLKVQTLLSVWDASEELWVYTWKYEYNYNANDALLVETEYEWDVDLLTWVLSWKTDYTYNVNEQLSTKEEYNWDSETSLWTDYWESILTYDAGGNVDQQTDSEFLEPDGPWQEQWKGVYTFDEQNNPLTETYSQWDETSTQLVNTARYEYLYDQGTLLSELVAPPISWYVADYKLQITSKPLGYVSYEYSTDLSDFEVYFQEVYFYNAHFPTHVPGSEASHIASVFPNPAREYITITFAGEYNQASFELYDVTGRRVMQKRVENSESLNLEELQNGIYFFRITAEEQIQTGKLMKK